MNAGRAVVRARPAARAPIAARFAAPPLRRSGLSAKKHPPGAVRRPKAEDCPGQVFLRSGRGYDVGVAAAATVFFIHSVVTLFGRSIGVPMARLMISCDSMPIARETENSTV